MVGKKKFWCELDGHCLQLHCQEAIATATLPPPPPPPLHAAPALPCAAPWTF